MGWDLAAIGTSTENTALEKILLDYCEAEQGDLALCCFLIGGYNINSPSDMQWTTGESASYFNWSEYYEEPNDLPGSCLYNCVENSGSLESGETRTAMKLELQSISAKNIENLYFIHEINK